MIDFEFDAETLEMLYAAEPEVDYDDYNMEDMEQASDYLLELDK